jgi:hypothetical protein
VRQVDVLGHGAHRRPATCCPAPGGRVRRAPRRRCGAACRARGSIRPCRAARPG